MTIQNVAIPRSSATSDSNSKPLVLVVDDDKDNLLLLQYSLELFNCGFVGRTNGIDLVSIAQSIQPHLILLDIVMPRQSGIELLRQLRESASTRPIPVVAITALGRADDRLRLLAEGFDDYLSKPFTLDDLQAVINFHCCQATRR
ncbi:response regulator [Leptolyngbya sp. FACHB-711]|uniref:response regulator n=1 Tax=unclassified Leptolyngbya TaxID=2650499 RepID=UPI001682F512|nr:response regulator [Leptolyngbya sp. FACHB-711]MBD1849620.1 response regulator [Cyanobacteria bacterium FACHB-502]MBD2025675.1 response regulator [Leptolyngbya sp. FACHB-711]